MSKVEHFRDANSKSIYISEGAANNGTYRIISFVYILYTVRLCSDFYMEETYKRWHITFRSTYAAGPHIAPLTLLDLKSAELSMCGVLHCKSEL